MIRPERLVALMLPSLLACGPGGSLSVFFDTSSQPQEVAFQDGDGPWRVVPLVDGAAVLPVSDPSGRYGIATSNVSGFSKVTKSTLWVQSRFEVRSSAKGYSVSPTPVLRRVMLTGLKMGTAYSAWLGFNGPSDFVATAETFDLSLPQSDWESGPLVVLERFDAQPRVFTMTDTSGPEVALEGGVDLEVHALPLTGLAASDRVVVFTDCVMPTPSGVTRLELESDGRKGSGARGYRLPPPFDCEYFVVVQRDEGVTWFRSVGADEQAALPGLTVHLDRLAGSVSWTPKVLDDDSQLTFRIGALNAEVHPSWRRGASSVSVGDFSAAPLLGASARRGPEASVQLRVGPWSFDWQHVVTQ